MRRKLFKAVAILTSICCLGATAVSAELLEDDALLEEEVVQVGNPDDHGSQGTPEQDPTLHHVDHENLEGEMTLVKEATCTTPAIYRFLCDKYPEETHWHEDLVYEKPYGHVWSHDVDGEYWGRVITEPTCTEPGAAEDFCTVCGVVNTEVLPRVIDPLGHDWESKQDDAWCIIKGNVTRTCRRCGLQEDMGRTGVVDPNHHDWDEWVTETTTCINEISDEFPHGRVDLLQVRWCKLCGTKEQRVISIQPPFEVIKRRLVDCYHEIRTYRCSLCNGEIHNDWDEDVDAIAHHFIQTPEYEKERVNPTCETDGYVIYRCIYDDEEEEKYTEHTTEALPDHNYKYVHEAEYDPEHYPDDATVLPKVILPKLGHEWGDWIVRHEPNEQDNEFGYWMRKCERCGKVEERVSYYAPEECADDAHKWEVTDTVPATCTTAGKVTSKCFVCGADKTEEIAPLGHDYAEEVVAPTCTEAGKKVLTCTRCGDVKEEEGAPAAGHAFDPEKEIIVAASCKKDGKIVNTCSVCGEVVTEVIPALGHDIVVDAAVPATKKDSGLSEGAHCSICDEVIIPQTVIPRIGSELPKTVIYRLFDEGEGVMRVRWTAVEGVDGVQFAWATNADFSDAKYSTENRTNNQRRFGLAPATYYVKARTYTVDADGSRTYSGWSGVKTVAIGTKLEAPVSVDMVDRGNGSSVGFTVVPGGDCDGYQISYDGGKTHTAAGNSFIRKLGKGTHNVQIRAYKAYAFGNSTEKVWSAWVDAGTVIVK